MLDYCRKQAEQKGINNIVYCHSGLLTYEHKSELADAAVCVAVLHHLPDFWKQVALTRCCGMLRPGGQLMLFDIVFPSGTDNLNDTIDTWINSMASVVDARMAEEAIIHVRNEFSSYDWIMEGIITRSGFDISSKDYSNWVQATYVCTRR
jgi:2-polyprenyl-3-methyl-5-hydroxy-6-metoxy-1,4-benzoquinol methylase